MVRQTDKPVSYVYRQAIVRAGLWFVTALAITLVGACGSQEVPDPTAIPRVVPTAAPVAPTSIPTAETSPAPATPTATPAPAAPPARPPAPNFSLLEAGGGEVSLPTLLEGHTAAVLVFYRGFF